MRNFLRTKHSPVLMVFLSSATLIASEAVFATEEIVVTGSETEFYTSNQTDDWVDQLNYEQLMMHKSRERQRQYAVQQAAERERNLARCIAQADANEDLCAFKANITRSNNMEKCGKLANGVSVSLSGPKGSGMTLSGSSAYSHCTNMVKVYFSTETAGCRAIASAERNRCQQEY
ncbi:hypothetical protein [Marinimicrobium locisalis]|uniref:hypothetical protein n=1 Tax=Marinimicrobium locisalis TaxID=546022 RepID=UPI003221DBCB